MKKYYKFPYFTSIFLEFPASEGGTLNRMNVPPQKPPKTTKNEVPGRSWSRTRKSAQKCDDLWWPRAPFGEPFGLPNPSKKHEKTYEFLKRSQERLFMVV